MKDYAPVLLEQMVTNAGTKAPKSLGALSSETGFTPAQIQGILNLLAKEGLVRLLDPQDQIWEISHDFIAHHVLQVLRSRRRSVFEAARPWLSLSAVILWGLALFVALPPYVVNARNLREAQAALAQKTQEEEAMQAIAKMGMSIYRSPGAAYYDASLYHGESLSTVTAEELLTALSKATSVGGLYLSGLTLNDECCDLIAEMTWPKGLELDSFPGDEHDLPIAGMTGLESLEVSGRLSDQNLKQAASHTSLKSLNLGDCDIVDEDLPLIAGMTSLESLSLNGNGITDAGLANLGWLTSLKYLNLEDTQITVSGLRVLSGLSSLESLRVNNLDIGSEGLRQVPNLRSLKSLYVDNCNIGDYGLACLSELTSLQSLSLNGNRITDAGLASLGNLTSLDYLRLDANDIAGDGLASLSNLKSLGHLSLQSNHISGPSLIHLANLTSLTHLHLENNNISESDLVEYLKGPPTLEALGAGRLSSETMAALLDSMPNLNFNIVFN